MYRQRMVYIPSRCGMGKYFSKSWCQKRIRYVNYPDCMLDKVSDAKVLGKKITLFVHTFWQIFRGIYYYIPTWSTSLRWTLAHYALHNFNELVPIGKIDLVLHNLWWTFFEFDSIKRPKTTGINSMIAAIRFSIRYNHLLCIAFGAHFFSIVAFSQ